MRAALTQLEELSAVRGAPASQSEADEDAADDAEDARAHRRARAVKWLGLIGLITHWVVFARLTFWELSWDVVRPHVGARWLTCLLRTD